MPRLLLLRHAPSAHPAQLSGRTDVPAALPSLADLTRAQARLAGLCPPAPRLISSPLQRCRQSAAALFPDSALILDPRLQEQHFGAWEGMDLAALPDLGPLGLPALAAHRPPGGESFLDLAARAGAALAEIAAQGDAVLITHAGIIRAALGLALGDAAQGLAFEIAPLSATALTALPGGAWSIGFTNLALAAS